ncbi:MAG: ArsC/Spx/MgsR family protein [Aeromonas sp.]
MVMLYGLGRNQCDSMKKACQWLENAGVAYQLHDVRQAGLPSALLDDWLASDLGGDLVNKRSTTYRALSAEDKAALAGPEAQSCARRLLLANPTLLKRPVLTYGEQIMVGFNADRYQQLLSTTP